MCHKKVGNKENLNSFFTTVSLSVVAQCLASWFSYQENSWIFDTSCKDLGNYSLQGSQDSARFFKIVEWNPKKNLDLLATKPRMPKILARDLQKSIIKVIQNLQISYEQLSLKTQKILLATLVCVFLF